MLTGYTLSYRYTKTPLYLATAIKTADYWCDQVDALFTKPPLPAAARYVPVSLTRLSANCSAVRPLKERDCTQNFDLADLGPTISPASNLTLRDASAAAIASSALYELATFAPSTKAARYKAMAADLLHNLVAGDYKTDFEQTEGAVQHCNALDTDVSWADFYVAEASRRARGVFP